MNKVGHITFFESNNYGTVLQAYALQHVISKLGYESEIINFKRDTVLKTKDTRKKYFRLFQKLRQTPDLLLIFYPFVKNRNRNKVLNFNKFRNNYLKISQKKYDSIEKISEDEVNYSLFITGSDMVWSSDRSNNLDIYFLQFTKTNKRIAYAPSFGSSMLSKQEQKYYKDLLDGFVHISCRERNGVNIVKKLTGRNDIPLVVDPTLLLKKNEWVNKFNLSNLKAKPYVLCYLFEGLSKELKSKVYKFAKSLGYNVKFIPMSFKDHLLDCVFRTEGYGPIEYLQLFFNASFVFTNSYHGLLFSLIFEKSFLVIKRKKHKHWAQFEDRLESMLSYLNLSERFIDEESILHKDIVNINYVSILKKFEILRKYSIGYLEESINNSLKLQKNE